MLQCPRCHNLIATEAIECPHCRLVLKAYGHQGIPLHHSPGETYLCDTCIYHTDDTCTYPQRPYASTCTMYCDSLTLTEAAPVLSPSQKFKLWCRRHQGLLILAGLVVISILIVLLQ